VRFPIVNRIGGGREAQRCCIPIRSDTVGDSSYAPTTGQASRQEGPNGNEGGTPDPDRSGPATAIVVGDSAYLIDFGPGVVRRAEAVLLAPSLLALQN
jgi:hypothetical protein